MPAVGLELHTQYGHIKVCTPSMDVPSHPCHYPGSGASIYYQPMVVNNTPSQGQVAQRYQDMAHHHMNGVTWVFTLSYIKWYRGI